MDEVQLPQGYRATTKSGLANKIRLYAIFDVELTLRKLLQYFVNPDQITDLCYTMENSRNCIKLLY